MSASPLVSVVMPFFNAAAFIEKAIESVLSQTYTQWELVLVDDGSRDCSMEIAKQFAALYPSQVLWLEHPGRANRGPDASRRIGIEHSAGQYIAFLDADDFYMPQKLERQVSILERYPQAGLVYSASYYWYGWTGDPADVLQDRIADLGVPSDRLYDPPELLTVYLRNGAVVPCPCGWLARRTVIEMDGASEYGLDFLYEDQVFLAKMCLAAPVYVASGCWDKYRQHDASATARAKPSRWHQKLRPDPVRLVFLDWLQAYASKRDIRDPEFWTALRSARWPYRHPFLYGVTAAGRSFSRKAERLWGRMSRIPAKRSRAA